MPGRNVSNPCLDLQIYTVSFSKALGNKYHLSGVWKNKN